ncbi:transcription initiation factor TFIID subunit 4-like isoform X2 [Scophthalmus maximus]|uniref:transcription initiation factor TFIID subunit 4-like isoform X2 n=1 Tax=Scophthalmus maximus TaxID=52904 RepID=UPI0015E14C88|nr:transcription initiation factor TFIID subunit 4-like isoform X2 [Scophthalmus maximus]
MAAGSDLLGDVFLGAELDEKVVSDVVGSLERELTAAADARVRPAAGAVGSAAVARNSGVHGGKMGLSGADEHGGVTGAAGPDTDGAAGTPSPAGPSATAAQSQPKSGAASCVGTPAALTVNGSAVVVNCRVPGGSSADSSLSPPPVDGGSVAAAQSTAPVVSAKSVPTVTLVRPPMQTPTNTGGVNPPSGLTAAAPVTVVGPLVNTKCDPAKTPLQTGVVAPTLRSPTGPQILRTSVPSAVSSAPPGGVRVIAPQVLAPRQNAPNIQNIQLPPGMVLVRSESGQLLMIHQQTLAQMQAQSQSQSAMTPRPAAPTSTPPVHITSLQAPGSSLLARSVAPTTTTTTTIIKQGSTAQTTMTTTSKLQRPPVLQNTIMLGAGATTPGQPLGTSTTTVPGGAVATTGTQRVGPPVATGTPMAPTPVTAETLENVKKCRNFLSTLIKLASSGKQSSETIASVKELVKHLLEAKMEPEDFTSRLYRELNSSPQPYLVPFLKRSLPALRQMTPDPEAFIQQSLLPLPNTQSVAASTALTAVVLRPPLSSTTAKAAVSSTAAKSHTVISLSQSPHGRAGLGATVRPQVTVAPSPMVTLRGQPHSRIIVGPTQVVKQLQTVPAVKQTLAQGSRGHVVTQTLAGAQRNQLKEAGAGNFRDDDDINDVASMAGVNLSEESARILATNSDLMGTVTRSCKDEAFLSSSSLARRVLLIGKKFGISELGSDVVNYISHAAQQRLQSLLEKVSQVAQQKNVSFKEDERHQQVSDVRAQLKFFEQLDQMEKQRKEEQEREILLKAAKSRSRQEDPEQLRLKQKAKEMQQQELAQIMQREANLTALAAIGPRKKRKTFSPVRGAGAEGSGSGPCPPSGSGGSGSRQFLRQRITRVNLRDLLLCLENETGTSRSQLLYKGFLK